jgi:alkanesulfonate monooxygenase SsuD/methylene tetrahydromethanopterin reductase-like flavin-dependent oxidoreductase (luciferase family)
VLADSDAEAQERAAFIRRQQVSGATAMFMLEQLWNRDLSKYDPDGPLPDVDPDLSEPSVVQGRAGMYRDPMATAKEWREIAEAEHLSIRELVIRTTGRQSFIGTPGRVAELIDSYVQDDACDGFILVPHVTPGGLDEFADTVVPILQERGHFRTDYSGPTLRDHLGLPAPRSSTSRRSAAGPPGAQTAVG